MKKINIWIGFTILLLIPFYFVRFKVLEIPTNVFEVGVLLYFLATILSTKKYKKIDTKTIVFFIALLLVVLLSGLLFNNIEKGLGITKGWFIVPIIFSWLIYQNFDKKILHIISIAFLINVVVVSLWAIAQKYGFIELVGYQKGVEDFKIYFTEGRYFGPFESPNYLSMFLAPASFMALPIFDKFNNKIIKALACILFLVLIVYTTYLSGSRAGLIALILSLVVWINYRYINTQIFYKRRRFFTLLFVALFLIVNAAFLYFFIKMDNASGGDIVRQQIYKYSFEVLQSNPLWGTGLGNFQQAIGIIGINNTSFIEFGYQYALHPHNLLLAVWINLGLAGLFFFLCSLVQFFKNVFLTNDPFRAALVGAMVAIIIHGIFDTTYFKNDLAAIFWLIFVMSYIIRSQSSHEKTV